MANDAETDWVNPKAKAAIDIANDRGDLIKRLFAVAISIGFGVAVVSSDWVKNGTPPNRSEWDQIFTVAVAMSATVLSWDGYLQSIRAKPLFDNLRFSIDVILVFSYLFLFVTSKHSDFWIPIICFMFCLYIVWDYLSARCFPMQYGLGANHPDRAIKLIFDLYVSPLSERSPVNRGPVITLLWAIFFFVLWVIYNTIYVNHIITCISVMVALYLYRTDKRTYRNDIRGFAHHIRFLLIASLWLMVIALSCIITSGLVTV